MNKLLSIALLICAAAPAHAEDKFLRDLAVTRGFMLGRPTHAQPTPDGTAVLFLRSQPREPNNALYSFDVATGQTRSLLTPADLLKGAEESLSAAEKAQRERQRIATRGFTHFTLSDDGKLILVGLSGRLYVVRRADNHVTELKTGAQPAMNATFSPDATKVAYVHERDLYVYDLKSRRETRLTRSNDPAISNGVAEFVAQEEMDRVQGFWWAPDGRSLAYEQVDNHGVEQLSIPDVAHPETKPEMTYYPRAGHTNAKVKLGLISVGGGATTWVKWDVQKLPYLVRVVWRDHAPLTLLVEARDQQDAQLLASDGRGRAHLLVAEHDDVWLTLEPSVPRWLPDGSAFLWSAVHDDWLTLELRGKDGKLIRTLSTAKENYAGLEHVDAAHRLAWFVGAPTAPELQVYRVSLDGGAPMPVTRGEGLHDASFSRHGDRAWVETVRTPTTMPRQLVHVSGEAGGGDRVAGELPSVAVKPPFMSKEERLQVGALRYWAAIVRPRHFDAKRKYPVIVDVYAGPGYQTVLAAPALMRQWMADHGVIVVSFDGRGTPGRGRAWERYIAGDFSRTIDDQAAALQALGKKYPELDLSRVGITGWSFGGYESALAVLKRGDVFQVAAAGAPVVDWRDYDTYYTERYMGLPGPNKTGYDDASLLSYAPKLQRPLLVIHGTSDDNVYFFHSLKLTQALFLAGKSAHLDFLPLAGFTHMVPDPNVKEQLYTRIMGFLLKVLEPGKPATATATASR
jgi:dipeptidyl-peptidase-4